MEDIEKAQEAKEIAWHKQLREANPDKEFADDDSLNEGISEYIQRLSEENATGKEAQENAKKVNEALIEAFEAHPEVANFMDDLIKGASPEVAIARNFDLDNLSPVEGEPDYDQWSKASEERKGKIAKSQEFAKELDANKVDSSKMFAAFSKSRGMDEAQEDEFLSKIDGFLNNIYRGKVTMDFLEAIETALNHNGEVGKATEQARVEERNKKIEVQKVNQKPKGDGLPSIQSSGEKKEAPKKEEQYADRLMRNYQSKQIDV